MELSWPILASIVARSVCPYVRCDSGVSLQGCTRPSADGPCAACWCPASGSLREAFACAKQPLLGRQPSLQEALL